tara:strand:- start:199 stop:711 length:513 start_codon:yes stop_codon:yes gene_type:complete
MVRTYDNVLPNKLCENLIKLFDSSEHREYVNNNHKPCFTQLNLNQYHGDFLSLLIPYVAKIYNQYKTKFLPKLSSLEEFRIKKYMTTGDERFDEHVDVVNHATAKRAVAFLFYLNDNNGYTTFNNHDLNIEPKRGKVLVFPPTWEYPHSGLPPSDYPKYILSTYIHYGTN